MLTHLRFGCGMLALVFAGVVAGPAQAQQQMVTQSTPFNSVNNSFFERIGTSWSISHPGGRNTGPFFLNFGGFPNATPAFGNFAPGAGVSGGVAGGAGNGWNYNIFGEASQGARSSIVSQTPSVTTMNGQLGFIADQAQSPFVISVVPVVGAGQGPFGDFGASNTVRGRLMRGEAMLRQPENGTQGTIDFGAPPSIRPVGENAIPQLGGAEAPIPLRREHEAGPPVKMNRDPLVLKAEPSTASAPSGAGGGRAVGPSSAEQGVASIEEIRRRQAAERETEAVTQRSEAETSFVRGQAAEGEGRLGAAKIHYQMALRRAAALKDGTALQSQIQARLDAIAK